MQRNTLLVARLAFVALVALGAPCCGEAPDPDTATTTDRPTSESWRIEPTPAFSIAEGAEPREFQFYIAESGLILANGDVVVVNMGAKELVFMDSTGRAKHVVGREGSGPGEFRIMGHPVYAGEGVAVWDIRLRRTSFYSSDAEYLADHPFPSGRALALLGATADGSAVGAPLFARADVPRRQVVLWDSAGEVVREIPGLPDPPPAEVTYEIPRPGRPIGVHMGLGPHCLPEVVYTMVGATVYAVHTGSAKVFAIEPSGGRREIFHETERASITEETLDAVARAMTMPDLGQPPAPPEAVDAVQERIGRVGSPMPSKWSDAVPDPTGRIWLQVATCYSRPEFDEWQVIDTAGVLVATALVPSALDVLAVRGSRLLARRHNELGLEFIEVYRITRSGDGDQVQGR